MHFVHKTKRLLKHDNEESMAGNAGGFDGPNNKRSQKKISCVTMVDLTFLGIGYGVGVTGGLCLFVCEMVWRKK